jgi:hypothetical protein
MPASAHGRAGQGCFEIADAQMVVVFQPASDQGNGTSLHERTPCASRVSRSAWTSETRSLLRMYEEGLSGYTYLERG